MIGDLSVFLVVMLREESVMLRRSHGCFWTLSRYLVPRIWPLSKRNPVLFITPLRLVVIHAILDIDAITKFNKNVILYFSTWIWYCRQGLKILTLSANFDIYYPSFIFPFLWLLIGRSFNPHLVRIIWTRPYFPRALSFLTL